MDTQSQFFEAIQSGEAETVARLLEQDPGLVNARTEQGLSAVLLAMYYNEPAIAQSLVESGAVLDIFEAAATGRVDRLQILLEQQPEGVNGYAQDGFQPLGLAAFFGHNAAVDLLLAKGAEVNSPSRNAMRVTPLHSAAAAGRLEIARSLLEHGADTNAREAGDFTALHAAAQNGQVEMVELLLSYGATVDAHNEDGKTAIDFALEKGYTRIVNLLKRGEPG